MVAIMQSMGYDTETEICILNKKDVTMSRGKKDREEITNTEEVKETEVSDEMEKAEDSEKAMLQQPQSSPCV